MPAFPPFDGSRNPRGSVSRKSRRHGAARRPPIGTWVETLEPRQYLSVSSTDTAEVSHLIGLGGTATVDASLAVPVAPHGAPPSSSTSLISVQAPVFGATRGIDATFRISLNQAPGAGKSVAVNYTTKDGGAVAGIDYTARKGTVFFSGDETVKLVSVPIAATAPDRGLKPLTFSLVASGAVNAKLATDTATTTIGASMSGRMDSPVTDAFTYTPAQIRRAYGFDKIAADGAGTTIAIVDAYSSGNLRSDLAMFDRAFGLPDPPKLTIVNQRGGAELPAQDYGWGTEITLDVEWAHAIAPNANILLVCADSALPQDLAKAVDYARSFPNVVTVSNSYGLPEEYVDPTWLSLFDSKFVTPAGHNGVSFMVSTGDSGEVGAPAVSARALAVGGTDLYLDRGNNYLGELVWNDAWGVTGGGMSKIVPKPAFQSGVNTGGTGRGIPDVSFSGRDVPIYYTSPTFGGAYGGWQAVAGTSFSCPVWASLVALADGIRFSQGKDSLANVQEVMYQLPKTDFHDITLGDNGSFPAKPGYDLASGLGTPIADRVITHLAAYNGTNPTPDAIQPPKNSTPSVLKRLVSPGMFEHGHAPTPKSHNAATFQFTTADVPRQSVTATTASNAKTVTPPADPRAVRPAAGATANTSRAAVRAAVFASLARG